jgi:hypothetical protein
LARDQAAQGEDGNTDAAAGVPDLAADLAATRKLTDATHGAPWNMREPVPLGDVYHVHQTLRQEVHNHFDTGITRVDLEAAAKEGARLAMQTCKVEAAVAVAAAKEEAQKQAEAAEAAAVAAASAERKLELTRDDAEKATKALAEAEAEAAAAKLTAEEAEKAAVAEPGYWASLKVVLFLGPIGRFLAPVGELIADVW